MRGIYRRLTQPNDNIYRTNAVNADYRTTPADLK